ncbi:hypothetical protein VTN02DRAFT_2240 [Thermoascus thermophilus]
MIVDIERERERETARDQTSARHRCAQHDGSDHASLQAVSVWEISLIYLYLYLYKFFFILYYLYIDIYKGRARSLAASAPDRGRRGSWRLRAQKKDYILLRLRPAVDQFDSFFTSLWTASRRSHPRHASRVTSPEPVPSDESFSSLLLLLLLTSRLISSRRRRRMS